MSMRLSAVLAELVGGVVSTDGMAMVRGPGTHRVRDPGKGTLLLRPMRLLVASSAGDGRGGMSYA